MIPLGFDLRDDAAVYLAREWTDARRALYLLRDDVAWPKSVDSLVWPSPIDGLIWSERMVFRTRWPAKNPLKLWNQSYLRLIVRALVMDREAIRRVIVCRDHE